MGPHEDLRVLQLGGSQLNLAVKGLKCVVDDRCHCVQTVPQQLLTRIYASYRWVPGLRTVVPT